MTQGPVPGFELPIPFERSFDALLGLEYEEASPEHVRARLEVKPAILGRDGTVPLGVFAAMAEGMASIGTAIAVVPEGCVASGMTNETTVVAPVESGIIAADAERLAQLPDRWLWRVTVTANERLCATATVTIAVRASRAAS